jgi:bacterioferritin-associated ferredoxin
MAGIARIGSQSVIVCSCNVLSDQQIRSAISQCTRMSQVYGGLGCTAQCGRCTSTIKQIMREMTGTRSGNATQTS